MSFSLAQPCFVLRCTAICEGSQASLRACVRAREEILAASKRASERDNDDALLLLFVSSCLLSELK